MMMETFHTQYYYGNARRAFPVHIRRENWFEIEDGWNARSDVKVSTDNFLFWFQRFKKDSYIHHTLIDDKLNGQPLKDRRGRNLTLPYCFLLPGKGNLTCPAWVEKTLLFDGGSIRQTILRVNEIIKHWQ